MFWILTYFFFISTQEPLFKKKSPAAVPKVTTPYRYNTWLGTPGGTHDKIIF